MAGPVAVSSPPSRSRSGETTATSVMGPRVVADSVAAFGVDSDVIVVGTGLSGLIVAHELAAADRSVIMLDAEPLSSVGVRRTGRSAACSW